MSHSWLPLVLAALAREDVKEIHLPSGLQRAPDSPSGLNVSWRFDWPSNPATQMCPVLLSSFTSMVETE